MQYRSVKPKLPWCTTSNIFLAGGFSFLLAMLLATEANAENQAEENVVKESRPNNTANSATDQKSVERLFDELTRIAEKLSKDKNFTASNAGDLPAVLQDMSYSQYRSIRFRPESALWQQDSSFSVQLFHLGFVYQEPVVLKQFEPELGTQLIPYEPSLFEYGEQSKDLVKDLPTDLGFSGFRIHYPLNNPNYNDELVVFQGASYFRLVGQGEIYGLSGRGLAIDTGEPGGEEFPKFSEFWLVKPDQGANQISLLAMLTSSSVVGAYRFDISAGLPVSIRVTARLFPRKEIKKLGIAPLTSMYAHGENDRRGVDDFRPEVHDSDGLQLHTASGEWIWRPLSNPNQLQITSSSGANIGGFGLLQRDRDFDHYLDLEAHYERRPSFWVEPEGQWGEGRVELVEIPTNSETNDNIVAYWVPQTPVKPGQALEFNYRISSVGSNVPQHEMAKVVRTSIGWAAIPGTSNPPPKTKRQFIVDFQGGGINRLSKHLELAADLEIINGKSSDLTVTKLPGDQGWRVSFKLSPAKNGAVDMRLALKLNDQTLSETWNYVWTPSSDL